MNLDKLILLLGSIGTIFIFIVITLIANLGANISKDKTFLGFYKWYIGLVLINILSIFITLVYHYLLIDVSGERGPKGHTGKRGKEGQDNKCFCST